MAEFTRRTVLANPARPRAAAPKLKSKTTSPKRRRLSAAQLAAGFGGKRRQFAAVSPRRTTRRNTTTKRVSRRSNPGDIITLALANPAPALKGNKSTMARRRKRVASAPRATRRRRTVRRRKNPVQMVHRRRRRRAVAAAPRRRTRRAARRNPSMGRRRTRRNPSMGRAASGVSGFLVQGLWAIGGAASSKMLTQMVLGSSNTGLMGYGANLASAFLIGTGVKMVLRNPSAGNAVILGGVIQTLLRVLIDKTPFGERVSNIGMGDYMAQNFLTPQRLVDGLNSAQIEPPVMPLAAPQKGMSGIYGGSLY
jgi:hypothetical protein